MAETVTQITEYPSYVTGPLSRTIATAESLAQEPYQTYSGPRVADFSGLQQQAFSGVSGAAQAGMGGIGSAQTLAQQSAVGWPGANQSQYINPFVQQAIDPAALEMERAYQKNINQLQGQAGIAGAFGGSRQALLESEANRNYLEERGDLYARGYASAYDRAQAAYQQDQAQKLAAAQGLGALSEQSQLMGLRGTEALSQYGAQQQALEQERLNLAYQDFVEQRDWPYGQVSWLSGILRGLPQTGVVQTTVSPEAQQPNQAAQYLGAGIAGLGLIDRLFEI